MVYFKRAEFWHRRCLRYLLLVMCAHPFAKEALTLHLARSEGHERYFGCNLMHHKVLASSQQHLMAEAPRYYGPSRHRLVFDRFPGASGYAVYLAPSISRRDEDGFSSCLACPCHRAVPTTPPEGCASSDSLATHPVAFVRHEKTRPLGSIFWSGPPMGSLVLRPGDSLTILKMALSVSFIRLVSSTNVTQATGH